MRGTFVRITLGDYLSKTAGFITSVAMNWDIAYPWEIGLNDNETQKVPHILDVDISFTPIHNEAPVTTTKFIGKNETANETV